jgi:hypothetical protein
METVLVPFLSFAYQLADGLEQLCNTGLAVAGQRPNALSWHTQVFWQPGNRPNRHLLLSTAVPFPSSCCCSFALLLLVSLPQQYKQLAT